MLEDHQSKRRKNEVNRQLKNARSHDTGNREEVHKQDNPDQASPRTDRTRWSEVEEQSEPEPEVPLRGWGERRPSDDGNLEDKIRLKFVNDFAIPYNLG